MQNVSNPRWSVVSYDCRSPKMRVSAEPSLYVDLERRELEWDQDPRHDRDLRPVSDLTFAPDLSGVDFTSSCGGEAARFQVRSSHPIDRVVYEMIKETLAMPGTATTGVGDTFEFSFEKGEFVSLNLMRISRDGVVGKSIRVVAKDGVAFMVIPSPWKRMDLTSAVIAEGRVSLASHDDLFNYDLLLPDGISRFFPRVFSFIPGAVGSI